MSQCRIQILVFTLSYHFSFVMSNLLAPYICSLFSWTEMPFGMLIFGVHVCVCVLGPFLLPYSPQRLLSFMFDIVFFGYRFCLLLHGWSLCIGKTGYVLLICWFSTFWLILQRVVLDFESLPRQLFLIVNAQLDIFITVKLLLTLNPIACYRCYALRRWYFCLYSFSLNLLKLFMGISNVHETKPKTRASKFSRFRFAPFGRKLAVPKGKHWSRFFTHTPPPMLSCRNFSVSQQVVRSFTWILLWFMKIWLFLIVHRNWKSRKEPWLRIDWTDMALYLYIRIKDVETIACARTAHAHQPAVHGCKILSNYMNVIHKQWPIYSGPNRKIAEKSSPKRVWEKETEETEDYIESIVGWWNIFVCQLLKCRIVWTFWSLRLAKNTVFIVFVGLVVVDNDYDG